jgi:DNA-binding transcriptional MerR regulator
VINEVGINPVTLRAWERRYGLVKPKRSPGGHRLYSRQDIEMLKWLIERQKEGLSISSAVEMWRSQQQDHQEISRQIQTPVSEIGTGETMLDELREQWLSTCFAFDDQAANRTLDQAFVVAAPEMILSEVIQKGLAQIGELWNVGSISIQQEHFATAIAIRRVNALMAATATPTRAGHILVACPPGEQHDFILLMISYLVKRCGWDVVYLGSNVPLIDLDATIRSTSPRLFLSAAQSFNTAASLRTMSEYIYSLGIPLAYGGGIFNQIPAATQYISGYYLGTDVASVPQMVDRLVTAPPPMPTAQPVSLKYTQALLKLNEYGGAIAVHVSSAFRSEPITPAQLDNANAYLNQLIASALTLGDINLLDHSCDRLDHLLNSFGLSVLWVRKYYATYSKAVESYLREDGAIIVDWLAKYERSRLSE